MALSKIDPCLLVQDIELDPKAFQIKCPFTMCLSGSSLSGKSEFILQMVKYRNLLFDSTFERIIYCSPRNDHSIRSNYLQRLKLEFEKIELCTGLPNLKDLNLDHNFSPCLIIVDDLMTNLLNSQEMIDFATQYVHHYNLSLVCTFQNYFCPSNKFGKTFIKNSHYRVFFYNRLDQRELSIISSQIANCPKFFGENFQFLVENYPNLPSYYLFIDGQFRSPTPMQFWCRTNIFPNEKNEIEPIVFLKNPNYVRR